MGWRATDRACVDVRVSVRDVCEVEDKGTLVSVCERVSAGVLVRYYCGRECQGEGMSERTWVCLRGYRVYGWV